MRIGIAGLAHETHTFLPETTGRGPFDEDAVSGQALLEHFQGTNTAVGGFISRLDVDPAEVTVVPAVHTRGGVSGTVEDHVFEHYATRIVDSFADQDLDGILLYLHGAMVTDERTDPETDLVRWLRASVGSDVPIVAAMDLHGNVGQEFIRAIDGLAAYHSSPHVDQRRTGERAAALLLATVEGTRSPTMGITQPGLVVPSVFTATTVPPAKDIVARAITWQTNPELHDVSLRGRADDVLDVSVFFGFAWADVPQLGMSVVAVTDDDADLADAIATDIAEYAWGHRDDLTQPDSLRSVDAGVDHALRVGRQAENPVLLLDHADRLAETTYVLRALLERDVDSVAVPLVHDPEAVKVCAEVGVGAEVTLPVGSKSSPRGGGPVEVSGTVDYLGRVEYTSPGPLNEGEPVTHGQTAVIDADGCWIQVTSEMDGAGLTDTAPIEEYGYDPTDFDVIVSKSKTHFRAVFEDLASEIVIVDAPEYSPADLSHYTYERVTDGVYPITASQG